MLATRYKAKLPRGWSYPVGAELVSEHLADAAHLADLDLSFHWSRDVARVADQDGVAVGRVVFSRTERGRSADRLLLEMGFYDPRWELTIYAVPSLLKAAVRGALVESGFAALSEWLGRERPETWFYGRKSCSLAFSPSSGRLATSEKE